MVFEKKKKKRKSLSTRDVLIVCVITAVMLGVCGTIYRSFLAGALSFWGDVLENQCPADKPEKVEEIGQFKLPASTTNLVSDCRYGPDWGATVQFEMDADDLEPLLESLWLEAEHQPDKMPINIWIPEGNRPFEQMTDYFYSRTTSSVDLVQAILIDMTDPDTYIVYLDILAG